MINDLNGLHILIVEDEAPIAMLMEDILNDFGCHITQVARINHALDVINSDKFDAAILDVNVSGEQVYPVARALSLRKTPIIFSTGYGKDGVAPGFEHCPILQKPFVPSDLNKLITQAIKNPCVID